MLYREVWFFEGFKKLVLIILRGRRPSGKSTAIMATITKNYNDNKVWRYHKKPFFWVIYLFETSSFALSCEILFWAKWLFYYKAKPPLVHPNYHFFLSFLLCSPFHHCFLFILCIITTYGLHFFEFIWSVILYLCAWIVVTLFYLFIFLYIPNI